MKNNYVYILSFYLLAIAAMQLHGVVNAQITFQKNYIPTAMVGTSIQQTVDGGYIITGSSGDSNGLLLVKTDKNGDRIWQKIYGAGPGFSSGQAVKETNDGGYVAVGSTTNFGAGSVDVFTIKTDASGNALWVKTYGGIDEDMGTSVQQTSDSGYIIAGHTWSFGPAVRSAYAIRTDSNGDTLWTKSYGGFGYDRFYAVEQTWDGGFIFAGNTSSFGSGGGYEDGWLIKTDATGDTLWTKTYGGSNADRFLSVKQTTDGGYIALGEEYSFATAWCDVEPCVRVYLVKTNSAGNAIWQKNYGSPSANTLYRGTSVNLTIDGGYIIEGRTGSQPISGGPVWYDILLIKTNASGDTLWTRTYGGPSVEIWSANSFIQQTTDSGYVVLGTTGSFSGGGVYLIKTDSVGNSGCNEGTVNNMSVFGTSLPENYGCMVKNTATVVTSPSVPVSTPAITDSILCYNCFVVLVSKTDVTCNGGSNGSIDITLPAGTPPFTYLWSTGDTTEDVTGLAAGIYDVTIIDATGCNPKETITITQPPPLGSSFALTNVSCNGGSNGTINLTPLGGTPPYTYLWSTGSTTQDISGLTAGSYALTVTDTNGCQRTDNITITQPQPNVVTGTTTPSTDCDNTGTINITASGGTPPYTYSWSNGAATEDLDSVVAGLYYVIVADSNGCFGIASFTINEIPAFTLNISTNDATCGNADGSATLTTSGGTPPYSYLWSNGDTVSFTDSMAAGIYTVTVSDSTGCVETATAAVSNVAGPEITGTSVTNVACSGQCNGSASLTASGGTAPYSYLWNDSSGQNTPVATGLCDGVYTVSVTDSNGCMAVSSVTVNEPFPLSANIIVFSDVVCAGSNNGTATVLATGGTTPYIYLWSNGSTTSSATGLPADTSFVLVTDDNGCTDTDSVVLSEPSALTAAVQVNDVSCSGGNNGTATAIAAGGIPPYSYLWSNGQITSAASAFAAGTYNVSVSDSNGCQETVVFTINQPEALNIAIASTGVSCNGCNDGSATLTTSGGTPPYSYLWSTGDTTSTVTGLGAQTYFVNVTDSNGCSQMVFVTVGDYTGVSEESGFKNIVQIYPNPTSEFVTLQFSVPQNEDISIIIYSILGKQVYVRNIESAGNLTGEYKIDLSGLPGGMYLLQLEAGEIAVRKRVIKM